MVGRQIVDRAKIQRIIFEFDYYEKAFHQFYDTYRVVPGNLDYKTCIKHAEFSGCACSREHGSACSVYPEKSCDVKYDNQTWCDKHAVHISVDKKIVSNLQNAKHNGMFHLKAAKLITEDNMRFNSGDWLVDSQQSMTIMFTVANAAAGSTSCHEATATWNPNVSLFFRGLSKRDTIQSGYEAYRDAMEGHNMLVTFANKDNHNGWHNYDANSSVLSAKLSSELDAKIDDGRPGTGKILSLKSGFALMSQNNEDVLKKVCFDQLTPNVKSAIYNSDTNLKYGCNIIKVMEDVK